MYRPLIIVVLATAAIFCAILSSGCSEEMQTDTPVYNYSVPASGHVYLDGTAVSGARVTAVSADGAYRASNVTNDSGAYVLYPVPWTGYNVTASYQGLKQTIWPVYLHNITGGYTIIEDVADRYDIDLTRAQKATVTGIASYRSNFQTGIGGVYVIATPADGSATLTTVTADDGTYYLDLKPGVKYSITGKYYDVYGQYSGTHLIYRNSDQCSTLTLQPGETALVDIQVYWVHPPMSLYWTLGPKTGTGVDKPSVPTTVTGYVYYEGKGIKGAIVEAVALETGNRTSTVTSDNGAYILDLNTTVLYNITATGQGMRHTIRAIFPENNATCTYNINLTRTPTSVITGRSPDNEPWLARPGNVTIEAIPRYGGTTVRTVTDADLSYSLELEPYVYYNLTGRFPDASGVYHNIEFKSSTGVVMSEIMVHPNETVIVDYFTSLAYA